MSASNPWGESQQWSEGIPPEIHPGDVDVLTTLLRPLLRPGIVVVEIGSWVGNGSTRILTEALRPFGGKLYCVDTWAGSDNVAHHLEFRERYANLFPVFARNVERYRGRDVVRPLVMPSVEASRLFPDHSLDLVFIDGNHGYSAVKQDLAAWLPKVKSGGVLCGHDCDASYADLDPNLRREIESHREEDAYTNVRHPGPPAFHAGVVTAVYEQFRGRAKMWFQGNPSTVWSYDVERGVFARLSALFAKLRAPASTDARGPERAVTPWPPAPIDTPNERRLVLSEPADC